MQVEHSVRVSHEETIISVEENDCNSSTIYLYFERLRRGGRMGAGKGSKEGIWPEGDLRVQRIK